MRSRALAVLFLCAAVAVAARAGDGFKDCPDCPEMVAVPAGDFVMGSERAGEAPSHQVSIRAPFALGRREVTVAEWDACAAAGGCARVPSQASADPVTDVTWQEAMAYAAWLSKQTGVRYRLPSEAEWEYAARANGLPLDDMLGSVAEWTQDCWHESYAGAPSDGNPRSRSLRNSLPEPYATWAPADCSLRVVRGGSRATARDRAGIDSRNPTIGFRVARPLP